MFRAWIENNGNKLRVLSILALVFVFVGLYIGAADDFLCSKSLFSPAFKQCSDKVEFYGSLVFRTSLAILAALSLALFLLLSRNKKILIISLIAMNLIVYSIEMATCSNGGFINLCGIITAYIFFFVAGAVFAVLWNKLFSFNDKLSALMILTVLLTVSIYYAYGMAHFIEFHDSDLNQTTKSITGCNKMWIQKNRDACIVNLAISQNRPEWCNQIKNDDEKFSCLVNTNSLENSLGNCLLFNQTSIKNHCIREWAIKKRDWQACELITDLDAKEGCYIWRDSYPNE